uniref:Uncharacterized protein n=1 Tax=Romanomermis culicivorax TaxID=13658 RepID=A0A915HZB7_ROMCU
MRKPALKGFVTIIDEFEIFGYDRHQYMPRRSTNQYYCTYTSQFPNQICIINWKTWLMIYRQVFYSVFAVKIGSHETSSSAGD